MHGPEILARSLSRPTVEDKAGNVWQYHSRSDRHSKVACWGILLDLMRTSKPLAAQIASGEIVFGINHEMSEFRLGRPKKLDLVLCTPREGGSKKPVLFADLVRDYGIVLSVQEERALADSPSLRSGPVGTVRMALEAKACMTAHVKALPRLYDELTSSYATINHTSESAVAVCHVMVNAAPEFASSDLNKIRLGRSRKLSLTKHRQPEDARRAVAKVKDVRRRTRTDEPGFDGVGVVVVNCKNDGSPVTLVEVDPAPPPSDILHYDAMVRRVSQIYEARFARS